MVWLAGAAAAVMAAGCNRDTERSPRVGEGAGAGNERAAQGHDHDHPHAEVRTPATFSELVRFTREHLAGLGRELSAGDAGHAAEHAHALDTLAAAAGRTALVDPAVARDKVRDVNLSGKELSAAAHALHESLDSGRLDEARRSLGALSTLVEKVVSAAGMSGFICPMKCEAGKVYPAAGTCPVCRMGLARIGDEVYGVMVTSLSSVIAPGTPVDLKVELMSPEGGPVPDLEVVHEHPLHLMAVSADLSWYRHEHPERLPDGTFRQTLAFPGPGEYTFFADFVPKGHGQQVATAAIDIAGRPPERAALVEDIDAVREIDGLFIRMRCNGGPYIAGRDEVIRYGIAAGADGSPATDLEQIMGALGHLVIIGQDLRTFVHSHPLNDEVGKATGGSGGSHDGHAHSHAHHGPSPEALMARAAEYGNGSPHDPVFHVVFPAPGLYKSFAQFQRKGRVVTVPFTIDVRPAPEGQPAPSEAPGHDHSKMKSGA